MAESVGRLHHYSMACSRWDVDPLTALRAGAVVRMRYSMRLSVRVLKTVLVGANLQYVAND